MVSRKEFSFPLAKVPFMKSVSCEGSFYEKCKLPTFRMSFNGTFF